MFFKMLSRKLIHDRANYFALNISNKDNKRWESMGFVKSYKDEFNNDVYIKG